MRHKMEVADWAVVVFLSPDDLHLRPPQVKTHTVSKIFVPFNIESNALCLKKRQRLELYTVF